MNPHLILIAALALSSCSSTVLPDKTAVIQKGSVTPAVGLKDQEILAETATLFGYSKSGQSIATRFVLHPLKQLGVKPSESRGINLFVLGGTLIPGILSIDEIDFSQHRQTSKGIEMKVASRSTYVGIPPVCKNSKAWLQMKNGRVVLSFDNFYCNWMVIGNVIVGIKMELASVSENQAQGSFKVRVNGTANGAGKGLFVMDRQLKFKD